MSNLLDFLRTEAEQLSDSLLPSAAEVRPLLGALVARLERVETQALGSLQPPPEPPQPAAQTTVAVAEGAAGGTGGASSTTVADPGPTVAELQAANDQLRAELAAAQAQQAPPPPPPVPGTTA